MNRSLRKVAIASFALLLALLVNANVLQVVRAEDLRGRDGDTRAIIDAYSYARGDIIVGGQAVATSEETDDQLRYLRVYPQGPLYAHVTGYFSHVFLPTGIENAANEVLSGEDDRLFVQRLADRLTGRDREGGVVHLTIDRAVQRAAWEALGDRRGAAVALDPRTGAILAMVSKPSYDPSALSRHDSSAVQETYGDLNAREDDPLINRVLRATYPPGSTFKVVTAAAALEDGLTPDSVVDAPHRLDLPLTTNQLRNFGDSICDPSGEQSLRDALRISCNTAFGQLGLDLGDDALRAKAEAFGLNQPGPMVPLRTETSVFPGEPDEPQTALSAIGQYDVRITPLQAALIAAAVANDGVIMTPYLIQRLETPNLQPIETATPSEWRRAVSPEVAAQLADMMAAVVEGGSGRAAQISGVQVAGKTGTAQHAPDEPPHAWFIGFAPLDDPQVAVAVVVEGGASGDSEATGGRVAAPIARAMIEAALP